MRSLEITFPNSSREAINEVINRHSDFPWSIVRAERERFVVKTVIGGSADEQAFMDDLVDTLKDEENWTITVIAPEAFVSDGHNLGAEEGDKTDKSEEPKEKSKSTVLREEIYDSVSGGTEINTIYILMIILSTIVTAIGINTDDVAVVIGGMVIAPLLGPLLGEALGASLGDMKLIGRASLALAVGLSLALITAFITGLVEEVNLGSQQLQSRANISGNTLVLALAAGTAAGISVTSRLSSAFVGVMVAVALLPPTVVTSFYIVAGEYQNALRAFVLVLTNIVCVIFACQLTFILQGIRPREYKQIKLARKSRLISLAFWGAQLLFMSWAIWYLGLERG